MEFVYEKHKGWQWPIAFFRITRECRMWSRSESCMPPDYFGAAGTDVLLMRLRDEDVEILEENQAWLPPCRELLFYDHPASLPVFRLQRRTSAPLASQVSDFVCLHPGHGKLLLCCMRPTGSLTHGKGV